MKNKPFDSHFNTFGADTVQNTVRLYESLEMPLIKANQTGITQRNLSHWVKVLEENLTGNKQKKYSFREFVWLKIVEQLRTLNVGLESIKLFKEHLNQSVSIEGFLNTYEQKVRFSNELKLNKSQRDELNKILFTGKKETQSINFLHLAIVDNLITKEPLTFSIFADGTFLIKKRLDETTDSEYQNIRLYTEPHIVVSVSKIITDFLYSDLSGIVVPAIGLLSYGENKLFEVLHTGDYSAIVISFLSNNKSEITISKSANAKKKIIDLIKENKYSEINVKKSKGLITKIDRTVKVIL